MASAQDRRQRPEAYEAVTDLATCILLQERSLVASLLKTTAPLDTLRGAVRCTACLAHAAWRSIAER